MPKQRLDIRLHALGLTESREQARRLIMAGEVTVNGQTVDRPAAPVADDAVIAIKARPRFVSRGGEKLDAALEHFKIDVAGLVCVDVGASTGGFTDCLLQRGAARVYAIDVGRGILDYRLRSDPRVVVKEDTNARHLEHLPEPVQFVSIDASFISIKLLLPVVKNWLGGWGAGEQGSQGDSLHPSSFTLHPFVVVLIKPQFEAGRRDVGKGGVVRDPDVHRRVLREVLEFAARIGLRPRGLIRSPLTGPKGNAEFLAWLAPALSTSAALSVNSAEGPGAGETAERVAGMIEAALAE
jgi:23S rRNA (cytidine1920-2'-O)/16S rRNA (cytidine1409-2'-O)-methyltransferase